MKAVQLVGARVAYSESAFADLVLWRLLKPLKGSAHAFKYRLTYVARAWKTGKAQKTARISFATPELLWRVLTEKRWELLKVLCGAGPLSIREAARRAGRDVKAVHGDVTALLNAGVLSKTEDGHIVFPYEAVKVEFLLQAA